MRHTVIFDWEHITAWGAVLFGLGSGIIGFLVAIKNPNEFHSDDAQMLAFIMCCLMISVYVLGYLR